MLLSRYVIIKISPSNYRYWLSRGYNLKPTGGREGTNIGQKIKVPVFELAPKSNVKIACKCDKCETKYIQTFFRNKELCGSCGIKKRMFDSKFGTLSKGISRPYMVGEKHPRWNPNKTEFLTYSRKVRNLSEKEYIKHINLLNPNGLIRTICGTSGGYQLDHKLSIKKAFELKLLPETVAEYHNLQLIPWQLNLAKGA